MTFSCSLPWPPTVNNYYTVARGRKIISKKGRQFKKDCFLHIIPAFKKMDGPLVGDLILTIGVCMPDKRRRDLDNLLKPILDVLGLYGVYEDDSQIVDLRIRSVEGEKGSVNLTVKELEDV